MCLGLASGYKKDKKKDIDYGRVPDTCPFIEGIRECKKALCYHNILGGCFKKGSGYNPHGEHKGFTNYEHLKLMKVDVFAKQMATFECNAIFQFCKFNNLKIEDFDPQEIIAERAEQWQKFLEEEYKSEAESKGGEAK